MKERESPKKKLVERFFRLKHVDPSVASAQILQPEEVRALVDDVKGEFERRKEDRRAFELQWRLNQNFLAGNQYCDILTEVGEVVQQPSTFDWEMRTVYNQIAPIVETRLSKLTRVE